MDAEERMAEVDEKERGEERAAVQRPTCGNATFAEIIIRALQKE